MKEKYRHPEPSTQGLVAQYKLWAGLTTAATVFDYALNGNEGTVTDAIVGYPGFEFNATTSKIDCGSGSTIDDIFVGGGTVSWWQRSDGQGEGGTARAMSTTVWFISMISDVSTMRLFHLFDAGQNGVWEFPIVSEKWQLIAVVYNNDAGANNPICYVDGVSVLVNRTLEPGNDNALTDPASSLIIGAKTNGDFTWDGAISEVRLYSNMLISAQVKSLFELTKWRYQV